MQLNCVVSLKFTSKLSISKFHRLGQLSVDLAQSQKIKAYLWSAILEILQKKHQSYLQDTPHFLRIINKINSGPKLSENAMLVTSDITSAYHNIPQDDGSACLQEALEERADRSMEKKEVCIPII